MMGPMDPRYMAMMRGTPYMPIARGGQIYQPPQPYQNPAAAQISQTFGEFLHGYQQTKEAEKQEARQSVLQDMELMRLGIKPDYNKTAQNMKKAGMNVDLETPAPQVVANATAGPGFSVDAGPLGQQQMPAYQPTPQQVQAAQPLPEQGGFWNKIKQGLGIGEPRVNPNSAPVLALQQMQQRFDTQRGQQEELSTMQFQAHKDDLLLKRAILNGEPKAMEMGYGLGIVKRTPFEEFALENEKVGGTRAEAFNQWYGAALGMDKVRQQVMSMAEKMSDRFGGNLDQAKQYVQEIMTTGQSQLKPSMSFDEKMKLIEKTNDYQKLYPTLPRSVATLMANNDVVGDPKVREQIQKVLSLKDSKTGWLAFPSQGQLDNYYKQADLNMDQQRYNLATKQYLLSAQGQQNEMMRHYDNARLALFGQLRSQSNQEVNQAMDLYMKAESPDARKAAAQMVAGAMNKMPSFEINIPGTKDKVSFNPSKVTVEEIDRWFKDDQYYIRPVGDTSVSGGEKAPQTESESEKFFSKFLKQSLPSTFKATGSGLMNMYANPYLSGQPAYPNQYKVPGTY